MARIWNGSTDAEPVANRAVEVMLLERCRRGRENWTTAPGLQRRRFRHGPGLPEPLHHLQPDGEILLLFHHFAAHLRHVKQIQVVAAEEQDAERNDQQKGDRFFALDLHRAGLVRISLFGSRVEAMKGVGQSVVHGGKWKTN